MAKRVQLGRYGENPHQTAWSKRNESFKGPTVLNVPLHGSPLGYNNIRDANAALEVILDFPDTPAVAVLKHMNPCGLATGSTLAEAFENAWLGDEISAYGSIIGYSGEVDEQTFKKTIGKFVEVVVAPSYTDGALKWIRGNTKKSGLRVIPTGSLQRSRYTEKHTILGGEVSQTSDNRLYLCDSVEELFEAPRELTEPNSGLKYQVGTVTEAQLDSSMAGLVEFSIIAGKHTKSNAIILAYEYEEGKYRMLGMGAGQPNRMDSGEKLALPKANENMMRQFFREFGLDYAWTANRMIHNPAINQEITQKVHVYEREILSSHKIVLFSDAFFPNRDGLDAVADLGVKYVVAPGGSKADAQVIEAANQRGVAMTFTGMRHFKH